MNISFSPLLDMALPAGAKSSPTTRRRYRELVLFNVMMILGTCSLAVLVSATGGNGAIELIGACGGVSLAFLIAMLRVNLPFKFILAVSFAVATLVIISFTALTGGLLSPVMIWMLLVSVLTVIFLQGVAASLLLTVQAAALLVFVVGSVTELYFPQYFAQDQLRGAHALSVFAAWAVAVVVVGSHRRWQHQIQDSLNYTSNVDELTGLMSRSHFYSRATHELATAGRKGLPVAVLMIDLDRLKVINDEHGHAVGDQVLRAVGRVINQQLRDGDFCGRIGGDEFCALLPNTAAKDAHGAAERVQRAVAKIAPRRKHDRVTSVSISVGVAAYDGYKDVEALDDYLEMADKQMYRAKAARRA